MKINVKKTILITLIFIFVLIFLQTASFARATPYPTIETMEPDNYKTMLQSGEAQYLFVKGGKILNVLRKIAVAVSILTLSIIGVRYMVGSVEQKAEYKQTMVPVVIGCIMIGGLSAILTVIQALF